MDIKGITETSLMWFPSVAIRPVRYTRYSQFSRMSMAAEAMQQERRGVDKVYVLPPTRRDGSSRDTSYCP